MSTNYKPDAKSVSMFADDPPGPRAFTPAADQSPQSAIQQSELEVRSYRLIDSTIIGQLPFRYELYHPESDSDQPRTSQLVMRRLFAGEYSTRPLFVATHTVTSTRVGALQCRQRGSDERWTLQYLASGQAASQDNPAPVALLEHAIKQAGMGGARRLMARSFSDSALTGALRSTGFSAYAHEYIYWMPVAPDGDLSGAVRIQENSDVWGIHQLYLQTTPRDVQNAEAFTSHEWDVDLEGRSRRGWLITEGNGPTAYVRVRTTRKRHCLDAMFAPDAYNQLPTLLNSVFAVLHGESPRPVFVSVRGYQRELETAVATAGFELEADQLMMVRYTTAPVPSRVSEGFELLRSAESDPRRVPSYYVRDAHE